jgi:hypothetical protein
MVDRRANLQVSTSVVCSLLACTAMAQAVSFHFDIGTQSLSSALREYARISGQQIIFTEEVVAGIESTPLTGDFSALVALHHLLAGTDLITEISPSGAVMIRAAPRLPAAERTPAGRQEK